MNKQTRTTQQMRANRPTNKLINNLPDEQVKIEGSFDIALSSMFYEDA